MSVRTVVRIVTRLAYCCAYSVCISVGSICIEPDATVLEDVQHGVTPELVTPPLPVPAVNAMDAPLPEDTSNPGAFDTAVDTVVGYSEEAQGNPNLELLAAKLLTSRGLDEVDSAAHLTLPVASHLRRLKMISEPAPTNMPHLALRPFTGCVGLMDRLEELTVLIPTIAALSKYPERFPPREVHAASVIAEDSAVDVSRMLSALTLAPHASVYPKGKPQDVSIPWHLPPSNKIMQAAENH